MVRRAMIFAAVFVAALAITAVGRAQFVVGNAKRSPVITVAASDTPAKWRNRADFVCSGTADNTTIQSALAALPATGGRVVLLGGQYNIAAVITNTKPAVTIEGEGPATLLKLANAANCSIIKTTVTGSYRFRLRNLRLNGNKTQQTVALRYSAFTGTDANPTVLTTGSGTPFTGLTLTGAEAFVGGLKVITAGGGGAIYTIAANNDTTLTLGSNISTGGALTALNVYVYKDGTYAGPLVRIHSNATTNAQGEHMLFEGVEFEDAKDDCLYLEQCRRSKIVACKFRNGDKDGIHQTNYHTEIHECGFYELAGWGHYADQMEDCVFTGNSFAYCTLGGIYRLAVANLTGGQFYNCGYGVNIAISAEIHGAKFYGSTNQHIASPAYTGIVGNRFEAAGTHGINAATYCRIVGNYIFGSSTAASGVSSDLVLNDGNIVTGNVIGKATSPTEKYAVRVAVAGASAAASNRIYENRLYAGTTSALSWVSSQASDVAHHNIGYATENSGTATVANGATYIDVSHGLAGTPAAQRIRIVSTNDMGSAAKFWVSDIGASTFRINVNADPGAGTATFSWAASLAD